MDEWISVKDRLPEERDLVIVHGGVGYRISDVWLTLTGEPFPGKIIQWTVTHWMPLPEPPNVQKIDK